MEKFKEDITTQCTWMWMLIPSEKEQEICMGLGLENLNCFYLKLKEKVVNLERNIKKKKKKGSTN